MEDNRDILRSYMDRNHLKNTWLCEKLGKSEHWVSDLLNKKITVYTLKDAVKINEITNGFVPVAGWEK